MATQTETILDKTHSRYPGSRDEAYTRSYRAIRLMVGFLGISLPLIFIFVEAYLLKGSVHIRGSLSAYYHSPLQDVFVGGLCVIGALLATYMAGEWKTVDFWASLIGGVAVLGVVFFPTMRAGLPKGAPLCGSVPQPPSCSFVEQQLGEHTTAVIHAACAVVFILSLAVMSFLFAASEVQPKDGRTPVPRRRELKSQVRFWIYTACGLIILIAGVWAFWGAGVWQLTPLYIGEVASVWAFGVSWLLAGFSLTAPARHKVPASDAALVASP
jgi:multisubunit Na+/H+ antiporter MnhB subunit